MKFTRAIIVFLIPCLLFVLLFLSIKYFKFHKLPSNYSSEISVPLENGDLVFRKGRSIESYLVCIADSVKEFSHLGMVFMVDDNPYVIHSVPAESNKEEEFVRLEKLEKFLHTDKASHAAIYRPIYSKSQRNLAALEAYHFYEKKLSFDHQYDLSSESKLYCTELILKAFANAGIQLENINESKIDLGIINRQIILPGSFITNPSFKRIFNN